VVNRFEARPVKKRVVKPAAASELAP